jgi:hypothetical protein
MGGTVARTNAEKHVSLVEKPEKRVGLTIWKLRIMWEDNIKV